MEWEAVLDEVISRVGFCGLCNNNDQEDTSHDELTLAKTAIKNLTVQTRYSVQGLDRILSNHPKGQIHCEALLATLASCLDLEDQTELAIQVRNSSFLC